MAAKTVRFACLAPERHARDLKNALADTRYEFVGEARYGDELLDKLTQWKPQVVAIWLESEWHWEVPEGKGIGTIQRLVEQDRKIRIIALYDDDSKDLRVKAIKAGAQATLSFPFKRQEALEAIASAEMSLTGVVAMQRKQMRVKKALAVYYKKDTEGLLKRRRHGIVHDISVTGVSLRTSEELEAKTVLKLDIEIPGSPKIGARGKVIRCKPEAGLDTNTVGISFTEIKDADVDRLRDYIRETATRGDKGR